MSETAVYRESLSKFCNGMGLDLGFGGDPIVPHAITLDLETPYTKVGDAVQNLWGDAKYLHWFADDTLDFVYSSHLLEDFSPDETLFIVIEWLRVIKEGGVLVLNLPDERAYREYCKKTGQSRNMSHKNEQMSLSWFVSNIVEQLDDVSVVYVNSGPSYSFQIVLKKEYT